MEGLEIFEYVGEGYNPTMHYDTWRVAIANFGAHFDRDRYNYLEAHRLTDEVFVLLSGKASLVIGKSYVDSRAESAGSYKRTVDIPRLICCGNEEKNISRILAVAFNALKLC